MSASPSRIFAVSLAAFAIAAVLSVPIRAHRIATLPLQQPGPTAEPTPPRYYLPLALRQLRLDDLPPPSTAAPTLTPSATPTPPSLFRLSGGVREGSERGPGVPDVKIAWWIQSYSQRALTTDANGYYESRIYELHNETFSVKPSKAGFFFEPYSVTGRHWGLPGEEFHVVEFVAFRGPRTNFVQAASIEAMTGAKWFGTRGGVGRLSADGSWQTFTTADGLVCDTVLAIAIDAATGDKWFGTDPGPRGRGGVSRLGADGSWVTFTIPQTFILPHC